MFIVIDTNVFIAALIKNSLTRELILNTKARILFPELILDELRNHEQEIIKKSGISRQEYLFILSKLLKYVMVVPSELCLPFKEKAKEIMDKIDPDDSVFIATSLAFGKCVIWSDDKHFKKQKFVKIITTKDMSKNYKKR
ncbi:MAG: PIN domain-containing protein [Candidatus Pacearchaeota archaeon]|nr:MAG: PIN domain-containing protein [Candidatus Pacearchaeota archaeon]